MGNLLNAPCANSPFFETMPFFKSIKVETFLWKKKNLEKKVFTSNVTRFANNFIWHF